MESKILSIIELFFNLEAPCPIEIKDCEKHRKEYKKKIRFVESLGLCTPCEVTNIKNYYISIFRQNIKL